MYYNNFPARYPGTMMLYRGPRTVQVGGGPNFRKFFSSVYSGIRPLFSSAISALKGSAQAAGRDIVSNFGQKDFGDLIRGAGSTFVDDLRDRAVAKINRTGQSGSGYRRSMISYKRGVNPSMDLFGVNRSPYSVIKRQPRKRKISKKSIKIKRRTKRRPKKRKASVQIGKGKRRRKTKRTKKTTVKRRRKQPKNRQLDIFS